MKNRDYIIVGAGAAGCVLANRLSEDPDVQVLLLEAGSSDNRLQSRVPAGVGFALENPDLNWQFGAEPDSSRRDRREYWPAGRMLGGGTSINGMMFVRGHPADYDQWAQNGCTGWAYRDVLPYFKKLENNELGAGPFHGANGPLSVSFSRAPHPLDRVVMAAAQELGIHANPDLNGEKAEGFGPCQLSQRNGWRHGTSTAYLDPIRKRKNLMVKTRVTVERILFENNTAIGVAARENDKEIHYFASQGVIVAAGAIASPKLLMLSGIGPTQALADLGIKTQVDNPSVGANLQEHAGVSTSAHVTVKTHTSDLGPLALIGHIARFLVGGTGPLTASVGQLHGFVRTDPAMALPNIQIIYSPTAIEKSDSGGRPYSKPAITITAGLCRTRSRGRVSLASADPAAKPVINHSLLSDPNDLAELVAGLEIALRFYRTDSLSPYVVDIRFPKPEETSKQTLEDYVREESILMYHPSGTCRMGSDAESVVTPGLNVRGVDHLWVADASIIPTIPAGNINASCIMIGEKAADLVRAAQKRSVK